MNEFLTFIIAMYTFGIPMLLIFMFAEDDGKNYKDFYFDNKILNKLNTFGRLCYYLLTNFYLIYYYSWIILSWIIKILFLKRKNKLNKNTKKELRNENVRRRF